mmetsp:Transcript_51222/g.132977  ORF Transcript_51222/g.132977 Transcript_51222/m.132977 type:complete len:311 (+) Transcript_51222:3-935(+)
MSMLHPNDHPFRDRDKNREWAGEWASADKVLHERDRIQRAVSTAEATYMRHPPYPKAGGGVKNVEFSYMKSGYDYRLREPSKEVSGTWSIMRVRPLTESARINEEAAQARPCDTLGGGRWTIDRKYGNPVSFSPTTTGDSLRQASPTKWLQHPSISPPQTAPTSRKWRGGFVTDFPPRSARPAPPFVGAVPWLHHTEEYVDHMHTSVAVQGVHLRDQQRASFRPVREKAKELTGGDGRAQFWPQTPSNVYLPNPQLSCTWNQITPSSPLPPRAYIKTGRTDVSRDGLVSASAGMLREDPSAIGTISSTSR